jgi:catalase
MTDAVFMGTHTALFTKADPGYGSRVAESLGLDVEEVKRLAVPSAAERAKATALQA